MFNPTSGSKVPEEDWGEYSSPYESKSLTIHNHTEEEKESDSFAGVKSPLGAFLLGGVALTLKLSGPAIFCATIVGANLSPIIEGVQKVSSRLKLTPSKPEKSIRAREMTKEQALELLGVPKERMKDFDFIDEQYKKIIERVTPKVKLAPSGLSVGVNQLLENIKEAYKIAKQN